MPPKDFNNGSLPSVSECKTDIPSSLQGSDSQGKQCHPFWDIQSTQDAGQAQTANATQCLFKAVLWHSQGKEYTSSGPIHVCVQVQRNPKEAWRSNQSVPSVSECKTDIPSSLQGSDSQGKQCHPFWDSQTTQDAGQAQTANATQCLFKAVLCHSQGKECTSSGPIHVCVQVQRKLKEAWRSNQSVPSVSECKTDIPSSLPGSDSQGKQCHPFWDSQTTQDAGQAQTANATQCLFKAVLCHSQGKECTSSGPIHVCVQVQRNLKEAWRSNQSVPSVSECKTDIPSSLQGSDSQGKQCHPFRTAKLRKMLVRLRQRMQPNVSSKLFSVTAKGKSIHPPARYTYAYKCNATLKRLGAPINQSLQ